MMETCQRERHRACDTFPRRTSLSVNRAQGTGRTGTRRRRPDEGSPEMTTLKLTTRYARYLLTSLTTVDFGMILDN